MPRVQSSHNRGAPRYSARVWSRCIDLVKNCTGVIFDGNTDEHTDGRRDQTIDGQAQSRFGHGDYSRQNDGDRGQPFV